MTNDELINYRFDEIMATLNEAREWRKQTSSSLAALKERMSIFETTAYMFSAAISVAIATIVPFLKGKILGE